MICEQSYAQKAGTNLYYSCIVKENQRKQCVALCLILDTRVKHSNIVIQEPMIAIENDNI